MQINEINFKEYKTVTVPCLEYKSDGNTPTINNHRLYICDELFGDAELKGFALRIPQDTIHGYYTLYINYAGGINYIKETMIKPYADIDKLTKGIKTISERTTSEGYKAFLENAIENDYWIRKVLLVPLITLGEEELLRKCMVARKKIQERRENEEKQREAEYAERERREEEQRNNEIEAAKNEAVRKIKEGGKIYNEELYGKNIIQLLCDDADVKVPLKTKGWMMDLNKFVSFDNKLSVQYRGKNCSQKVFDIIRKLISYYKGEN